MRIRIVLGHALDYVAGETREIEIVRALRARGHDALVFRPSPIGTEDAANDYAEPLIRFFDIDDGSVIVHEATSARLLDRLRGDAPDVVILKGLGYRMTNDAAQAMLGKALIGAIVGGMPYDPGVDGTLSFMLAEYEGQVPDWFATRSSMRANLVLPKYIDWTRVDATPPAFPTREIDIVNVGNFDEERKNQEALIPLAADHAITMIGGGRRLPLFQQLLAHHERLTFAGYREAEEVIGLVKSAKLMIHSSLWEGFPRAVAESLACGTPVLAVRGGIAGGLDPEWAAVADPLDLARTGTELLGDPARLRRMGEAAEAFARRTYSIGNITDVVLRAISA